MLGLTFREGRGETLVQFAPSTDSVNSHYTEVAPGVYLVEISLSDDHDILFIDSDIDTVLYADGVYYFPSEQRTTLRKPRRYASWGIRRHDGPAQVVHSDGTTTLFANVVHKHVAAVMIISGQTAMIYTTNYQQYTLEIVDYGKHPVGPIADIIVAGTPRLCGSVDGDIYISMDGDPRFLMSADENNIYISTPDSPVYQVRLV